MNQSTGEAALRELEVLVGAWTMEATGADGQAWPGAAICTFEWHESGAHLVQRATIEMPEAPDNLAIIGCDGANGTYYQLYSDTRGVCRVYQMSIGNGVWRLWREGPPFAQRFSARFEDGGVTIAGRWELAEPGADYRTDFDVTYRKVR